MKPQTFRTAILVLSALGAVFAGFSLYEHTVLEAGASTGPSFCNINAAFNCDAVNASSYAKLFGLPLAAFGLSFYLMLFFGALKSTRNGVSSGFRSVTLFVTLFSVLFSAYLFYVSKFVIGTVCLFCLGMYLVNFALLITALRGASSGAASIGEGFKLLASFPFGFFSSTHFRRSFDALVLYGAVALVSFGAPHLYKEYLKTLPLPKRSGAGDFYAEWSKLPAHTIDVSGTGPLGADYGKGNPGSKIQIVEFFDYECPACRMFHGKLDTILQKYPGSTYFVAKNFPLDSSCNKGLPHGMHKSSCFAASVARCSGEQDKFWDAHELLFTLPAFGEHLEPEALERKVWIALSDLGVDVSAVDECVKSGRQIAKIQDDIALGVKLKLQGTPSVYINGRLTDLKNVEPVIEKLLR